MNETKTNIIEAAVKLFSQKGYAAVRTKEISQLAGINETTLFRYFKSKRELFKHVIISNVKTINNEELFYKNITGNFKKDIEIIATQLYEIYRSNAQIIKIILKSIIEDDDNLSQYVTDCKGGQVKKYLIEYFLNVKKNQGLKDDPELLANIFMNCMNGYLLTTFILENKEADLEYLKNMLNKLVLIIE